MDDDFPVEFWQSDPFWLDADLADPVPVVAPVAHVSAFDPYSTQLSNGFGQDNNLTGGGGGGDNSRNINKRMIEFSRKNWHEKNKEAVAGGDLEREKNYRHMLNERLRREKQRKSYHELHSMLPKKTKNDKNSIIQMATSTIQDLKTLERTLEKRYLELERVLAAKKREKENGTTTTTIRVALANPSSGINSMLAVLNVLKTVGVNAKAINASFFDAEFSAQLDIDTHMMEAAEVERVVQMTLKEAERKFQRQCQERTKFIKQSHF